VISLGLFQDALASEWTKLRSVRSTYWSMFATLVLGIGLSALIAWGNAHAFAHNPSFQDRIGFDATARSEAGVILAQLSLGVFAILVMTAEYGSGTIRTTLTATPQRGYVLAAKTLLVTSISLVTAFGIAFGAFFIGQAIFTGDHINVTLSDPHVLRAVVGSALNIGVITLLAMGLATMIRQSAGAITALVAVVFIVPIMSLLLPTDWQNDFSRYLPANAGRAITLVVPQSNALGPWVGFTVFLGWAVVALGTGWYLLRRRDV
jgi:ABC-2 type transport system permease protein